MCRLDHVSRTTGSDLYRQFFFSLSLSSFSLFFLSHVSLLICVRPNELPYMSVVTLYNLQELTKL